MTKAIAAIFIIFSTVTSAQKNIADQIKIPFTMTPDGHIIISAKVNGMEGKFIFDTGAGLNLLTKNFSDKIKDLEKTHHFLTGHRATGEEIQSGIWEASILEIDNFKIKKERFAVYDLEFPLDGLISLTPFINNPITLDFENKILTIESDNSLKKIIEHKDFEIPIQLYNDRGIDIGISTDIILNETLTLNVKLDSGAGFDVYRFNKRYMPALGIDSTKMESEYRKSYFQPEEGNTFYFTKLAKMTNKTKNVSIEDFKATFVEGLIYEGIMGINWIGKIITIDIPGKRLIAQK